MKVEIYSDVACPWCYIGTVRFERALAAFEGRDDVEVSFRPFQLSPDTPTEAQPLYDYYDQKFGPQFRSRHADVVAVAAEEGLDFRFDHALAVNTFTAHRLLWLTDREYGPTVQRAVKAALLRAYFTDGRDVGDTETLVGLATEAGVDPDLGRKWQTGDEGTEETAAAIQYAQRLGIQAVPTFVFDGRYAVQGAQGTDVFSSALAEVAGHEVVTGR
jgi:predicted DsbA family dithiol-disulfide isomerase